MSNSFDPDLSGPDLGPNYLQKIFADDKSRRRQAKFSIEMDTCKSILFCVSFSLVQWLFIKFSDFTPLSETDMQIDKHNYIC